jgi:hypothetical protein
MLDRTLKTLIVVLTLAGAMATNTAATPAAGHDSYTISLGSEAPARSAPVHRRHLRDEGCFEAPAPAPVAAPAPAPVPSCGTP